VKSYEARACILPSAGRVERPPPPPRASRCSRGGGGSAGTRRARGDVGQGHRIAFALRLLAARRVARNWPPPGVPSFPPTNPSTDRPTDRQPLLTTSIRQVHPLASAYLYIYTYYIHI